MNEDLAYVTYMDEQAKGPAFDAYMASLEAEAYARWAQDRRDEGEDDSLEAYIDWQTRDPFVF